jgi:hypothetical protein
MNPKSCFVIFDQPRYAGMKMFVAFIAFILSLMFLIAIPFSENYITYLLFWIVLGYFLLIRESLVIDKDSRQLIQTIYFYRFRYNNVFDVSEYDAMVVKLFWEDSYSKIHHVSKKMVGGTTVFFINTKTKETLFIETYATHKEAKPLIDFCTKKLGFEIRDEYQERIDASIMKRKFGLYK